MREDKQYLHVEGENYVDWLIEKLFEESDEIKQARISDDRKNMIEEMGDLIEVVRAIAVRMDIRWEDVELARKAKLNLKGGFEKGRVKI